MPLIVLKHPKKHFYSIFNPLNVDTLMIFYQNNNNYSSGYNIVYHYIQILVELKAWANLYDFRSLSQVPALGTSTENKEFNLARTARWYFQASNRLDAENPKTHLKISDYFEYCKTG